MCTQPIRHNTVVHAPVAQWIRASVFGTEGRRFESFRVYQIKKVSLSSLFYLVDAERIGTLSTQQAINPLLRYSRKMKQNYWHCSQSSSSLILSGLHSCRPIATAQMEILDLADKIQRIPCILPQQATYCLLHLVIVRLLAPVLIRASRHELTQQIFGQ